MAAQCFPFDRCAVKKLRLTDAKLKKIKKIESAYKLNEKTCPVVVIEGQRQKWTALKVLFCDWDCGNKHSVGIKVPVFLLVPFNLARIGNGHTARWTVWAVNTSCHLYFIHLGLYSTEFVWFKYIQLKSSGLWHDVNLICFPEHVTAGIIILSAFYSPWLLFLWSPTKLISASMSHTVISQALL